MRTAQVPAAPAVTFDELASLLRVTRKTVQRRLPVIKAMGVVELPRIGRKRLFARWSVDRYLAGTTRRTA